MTHLGQQCLRVSSVVIIVSFSFPITWDNQIPAHLLSTLLAAATCVSTYPPTTRLKRTESARPASSSGEEEEPGTVTATPSFSSLATEKIRRCAEDLD